jgi:hypothetical protein
LQAPALLASPYIISTGDMKTVSGVLAPYA